MLFEDRGARGNDRCLVCSGTVALCYLDSGLGFRIFWFGLFSIHKLLVVEKITNDVLFDDGSLVSSQFGKGDLWWCELTL